VIRAGAPVSRASAGLVLLHGRGGTAADILSLPAHAGLPEIAAIAPEAPGHSWWPTSFLAPAAQMEPFVEQGLAAVREAVAALETEGLARGRIWLGGFSQGACLAAEAFAREGAGLAGLLAFSGGLVGTGDASDTPDPALYGQRRKRFDYDGDLDGAQVWLSVHERDPHIPLARARESAEVFAALGAAVEFHPHPGAGHGVMQDDIAALRARLNR